MAVRIQFRRGTAAEWATANTTLGAGELGYETDTGAFKIGDGSTAWDTLAYSAISESHLNNAISSVVGLSPDTLDTLEELAAAIGDDPNFVNNIADDIAAAQAAAELHADEAVQTHEDSTTNIHGIADVSLLETTSGSQTKANLAQAAAESYADSAIANLVASAPSTLDTLNELAAALGDDPNFATTIATTLGEKLDFIIDTSVNLEQANAVSEANTIYIESDSTSYVRIGDGVTAYADLPWVGKAYAERVVSLHSEETTDIHGISNTANLVYQTDFNDLQTVVSDHVDATANIHGISNVANLVYQADLDAHAIESTNVHGITDAANIIYTDGLSTTLANYVSNADLATYQNTVDGLLSDLDTAKLNIDDAAGTYAPISAPTVSDLTATGFAILPVDTSIGDVSSSEISYLANVTSNIQEQLDSKLATGIAATTYAPIDSPDFTGNVVFDNAASLSIPANSNFSFGGLTAFDASSYLTGLTQSVQDALDNALYTAGGVFELPYGTSIGNTTFDEISSLQGLDTANVYSTQFNYLAGATDNIQDQLDAKAPIANAVFTGSTEAVDFTVTGNLIVQGTTTTVGAQNFTIKDNMVYLNQAELSEVTDAVGDGTNVVYTTADAHGYEVGNWVTVSNVTPSSFDFNATGLEILAVTENTFTVASTVTDTYVSGGTARGKVHSNPDLGWAAGRYADNTYAHAGVFRDATDGVFKFFDGYVPEPDESVFINTSDNTFSLAPIEAATVSAADFLPSNAIVFADNTVQTSAGVASITGFTEKTANYQLDSLTHKDNVVEMNSSSALTFTIPLESTFSWPIGASMDIIQTGTGQVTIDKESGVTLNYTPGNKLRTQWSSCTIMKRASDSWIVYGDLTA